ncbi:MAG TPA: BolA/IbaG family iron-sulfur metabolism protein [Polyangiaceae bacterium]|nr:BolA/IbaG family iron-sulfur metabolism protein [Polyangiaceae bacterium]
MIDPNRIRTILLEALPGADVDVQDLTGTQDHFQATIAAPQFSGKSLVEQHQMVYRALGDSMKAEIHALALKTKAK